MSPCRAPRSGESDESQDIKVQLGILTRASQRDETLRVDCSFNAVWSRPSWLVNTRTYIDLFGRLKPTAWMLVWTVESPHRTLKISLAGSQIVWVDWRWMPGPRCSVLGPFHPGLTIWHISHLPIFTSDTKTTLSLGSVRSPLGGHCSVQASVLWLVTDNGGSFSLGWGLWEGQT